GSTCDCSTCERPPTRRATRSAWWATARSPLADPAQDPTTEERRPARAHAAQRVVPRRGRSEAPKPPGLPQGDPPLRNPGRILRRLGMLALLAGASGAAALPITLKDSNGTRYNVNTAVEPVITSSNASGALTDATFLKPVTVTSFFVGFTPFFGFTTVF